MKITPTDLRTVQTKTLPCTVDLCGIVVDFKPTFSFTSKEGKELVKRDITVADDSAVSMTVTLWGDRAKSDDKLFEGKPVVSLKCVNVKEWQDARQGSLLQGGAMLFGAETPESQKVMEWWKSGGSGQALTYISQTSGGGSVRRGAAADLAEIRRASDVVSEQPELFTAACRLALVQLNKQGETQPLVYDACQELRQGSSLTCNRRVDERGFCASCNRSGKVAPRFNLRCRYSDFTDGLWMTTFHEGAERILGMTAEAAKTMEQASGREALEAAVRERYFTQPLQITVRAKLDTYQGQQRPNISCVDARPVSFAEHGRAMLKEIANLVAA
jgi:replication factor A1